MERPRRFLAAALAAALAACSRSAPPAVKLAIIAPLSGDMAAEGRGLQRSVTLAVEDAKASGTLPIPVEVVSYDDKNDPAEAAAAARQAVREKVFAVIGPMTSGCAIEAARALAPDGIPMITPSATAAELTLQQERPEWVGARVVFRLPPSDALQGDSDAEYARRRLGLASMAVIQDGTPYGQGLADSFRRGFESRAGAVPLYILAARGGKDFSDAAAQVARGKPDGVFFGGMYIEAGIFLRQARAAGFTGAFLSGDGAKSPDLFKYAGDAADGAYVSLSGVPLELLPDAQDFLARYRARWSDEPRTFDHYAYEAGSIALWALAQTGGDSRKAVEAIRARRHDTMVGTFIFDSKGDSLKSIITMLKADAKKKSFEPAY